MLAGRWLAARDAGAAPTGDENGTVGIAIAVIVGVVLLALLYFVMRSKPQLPELPEDRDEAGGRAAPKKDKLPAAREAEGKKPEPAGRAVEKPRGEAKAAPKPEEDEAKGPAKVQKTVLGLGAPAEPKKEAPSAEVAPAPASGRKPAEAEEAESEVSIEEAPAPPSTPRPPPAPARKRERDVAGLRKGLAKVRQSTGLFGRLKALFVGKREIDPALVEQMEEVLLTSDVGVKTSALLIGDLRERLEKNEFRDPERVWEALRERATEVVRSGEGGIRNHGRPTVVLMVGVNGSGKTTTIGKLATKLTAQGRKVLLVAGDTFRAAAVDQLKIWGERVGCEVFAGKDGADPAAVAFDAVSQAVKSGADVVLVDTAGRLHTKSNLMDELKKVARTVTKALPGAPHETLLVVDGTNGQNALQQAAMFKEALPLSGIVLTKLDGTAKGGVVLAIAAEHDLAVRYIGVGERPEDLRDFDAEEFVEAMLGQGDDAAAAA